MRTVRCSGRHRKGVSARGCARGSVCPMGMSARGRGVSAPVHAGIHPFPCGQKSWHTLVKTLPVRNVVADGNYWRTPAPKDLHFFNFMHIYAYLVLFSINHWLSHIHHPHPSHPPDVRSDTLSCSLSLSMRASVRISDPLANFCSSAAVSGSSSTSTM